MTTRSVAISMAGRIVCMHALQEKISRIEGSLNYVLATTKFQYVDWDWVGQQNEIVAALKNDLEQIRDI